VRVISKYVGAKIGKTGGIVPVFGVKVGDGEVSSGAERRRRSVGTPDRTVIIAPDGTGFKNIPHTGGIAHVCEK